MDYIEKRDCDFRICTSYEEARSFYQYSIKPPKKSDVLLQAARHTIYISIHQARFLDEIRSDMIPFYDDEAAGLGQR